MTRQSLLLAVLVAIAVVAGWWVLLYSPGQADIAALDEEIAAAEGETASLQGRVARLEAVRAAAPETEAAIAALRGIVPTDPAQAGAIRQLEAAAEDAGTEFPTVSISRPTPVDGVEGLHVMSVNLGTTGSYFQLVDLLRRLEDPAITSRGIRVSSLTVAPSEYPVLSAAITATMFAELPPGPEPGVVVVEEPPTDEGAVADDDASETGTEEGA